MRSNPTPQRATDGQVPANAHARLSKWRLKLVLLVAAVAVVVVAAGVYLAVSIRDPSALQYRPLQAGDEVNLRSGLALVMPPESTGFLESWRSLDERLGNEMDMAESGLIDVPALSGPESITLSVFWTPSEDPLAETPSRRWLFETGDLASVPSDSGIAVRWRKPRPVAGVSNVYIVSQLPGQLPGAIGFEDREATDAKLAWEAAYEMWQRLSISGAEFPAPLPGE